MATAVCELEDDLLVELIEKMVNEDTYNYCKEEAEYNVAVKQCCSEEGSVKKRRLSCLSHTLQLVMASFNTFCNSQDQPPLFVKVYKNVK